eukprot:scaffold2858_cov659-Pavlova_lutheri.AAC.36
MEERRGGGNNARDGLHAPNHRLEPPRTGKEGSRTYMNPSHPPPKRARPTNSKHAHLRRTLLVEGLEVLVDDGHRQKDPRARADGAHEIGQDRQGTDAHPPESRRGGNVTVQLLGQGGFPMTEHEHLLVSELLGHVLGRRARNLDPRLREQRASRKHKRDVDEGVEGVQCDVFQGGGRRDVVDHASHRNQLLAVLVLLPTAQQLDEEVPLVPLPQELRNEVQLDGIHPLLTAGPLGTDREVHAEALEVDDDQEDHHGRQEVGDVGKVLPVERLLERPQLVVAGDQQVKQGDDGAFELNPPSGVNGGGTEGLPDDVLADVGGNEERDARAQAVPLLQEFVQADDDDAGHDELQHDQSGIERTWGNPREDGVSLRLRDASWTFSGGNSHPVRRAPRSLTSPYIPETT